jgi:hypothetical protein
VLENKGLGGENDAPQETDKNIEVRMAPENTNGEHTKMSNGIRHTSEISAPTVEDEKPALVEDPVSSRREPQQVSEEAPPEAEHTEANLANSEKKDSDNSLNAAEDLAPATIHDHVQGEEIAPSSSIDMPKPKEISEEGPPSAAEPASSDETGSLADELTHDRTNLESNPAAPSTNSVSAKEEEVHMFPEVSAESTSHDVPRSEDSSDSFEENQLPDENPPTHDTSFTKKEAPNSEDNNEKCEEPIINAAEPPVEHAVSAVSRPEDPVVETELNQREAPSNVEEPEAKESNTVAETASSQVEAASNIEEAVVEISPAPIESQTEIEEALIIDERSAPLEFFYEPKEHQESAESIPEPVELTLDAEERAGQLPSDFMSEVELEDHSTLAENPVSDQSGQVESPSNMEEKGNCDGFVVDSIPVIQSGLEKTTIEAERSLTSEDLGHNEDEPTQPEILHSHESPASETKDEEHEPHHDEVALSLGPMESSEVETGKGTEDHSAPPEAKFSDPVLQEIQSKPAVFEDPEDVKAREEIAKLNAELMKAAMEEDAANQSVADEGSSEVVLGNEHTLYDPELGATHEEVSHGESSEPISEGSPSLFNANVSDDRTGEPPNVSHESETTLTESPEQPAGDGNTENSTERLDSAIDVQTSPQTAIDNARNDHSFEQEKKRHENNDLVVSEVAEETTPRDALHEPELSPHMDSGNIEGVGCGDAFDHAFEPSGLDATVKGSVSSASLNRSEEVHDSRNDDPTPEAQIEESHDISAALVTEEPEISHHDSDNEDIPLHAHEEDYDSVQNEEVFEHSYEEPSSQFSEPELPSHPPLSGADLMDEGREFPRAESPVTVLNSDDLFEDDDEDQVEDTNGPENGPLDDDDNREEDEEQDGPDTPIHIDDHASNGTSEPASPQNIPENEYDLPLNKQHRISQEVHRTNSGKFASLVDAIRSDVPIVSHLVKKEEVQEIGMPGGGHFSDEILDEYHQTEEPENDHPAFESWLQHEEDELHYSDYEEDARPSSPPLHIRTHTADTVPSFETYAQSDDSTPSTPDTVISPARQMMHEEPTIRESWMQQGEEMEHHGSAEELKSVASPLQQTEFDPFTSQTYPSYVSPKPSFANLQSKDEESPESYNSSPESVGIEREARNSTDPISEITAYPPQNASHATPSSDSLPFDSPRLYDSPISATRSLNSNSPSRSLFPTASTPPPPPLRSPHRPSFPPPSSLANPEKTASSITGSSIFQRTRSLFESSSRQETQSTPPLTRPRSVLYNTPSPAPKPSSLKSRPSSLYMRSPFNLNNEPIYNEAPTEPEDELLVPRSLDRNGKPPSPAFILPGERGKMGRGGEMREEEFTVRERRESSFLVGIGRLGELVGLEGSIHNPDRAEGKPLLGDSKNGH